MGGTRPMAGLLSNATPGSNPDLGLSERPARPQEAEFGLFALGQGGGDDRMSAPQIGFGLFRRQHPGLVERDPFGAGEVRRRPETWRMGERIEMLGGAFERKTRYRMPVGRHDAEHLAADFEDDRAFPLHAACRRR